MEDKQFTLLIKSRIYLYLQLISLTVGKRQIYSFSHGQGCNWGVGALGRAPPPGFHTLAKDRSTHFTLGLRPCIISSFLSLIYLRPPLKITQLRPCLESLNYAHDLSPLISPFKNNRDCELMHFLRGLFLHKDENFVRLYVYVLSCYFVL